MENERFTIVGDGAMATVCALLLEGQGYPVTVWSPFPDHIAALAQTRENKQYLPGYRLPEGISFTDRVDQALDGANLVVSAVPTQYIRPVWQQLAPAIGDGAAVVSVAKGVEEHTLLRPTQIIAEVLGESGQSTNHPLAAISGPSVASELARCLPATVCVASADPHLAQRVQRAFTTDWFRVYTNDDLFGVELAGATKNVIALAAGILDGLQAGNNAKSALLSRGLAEITRLGLAMGAKQQTFFGLAGVGDLATTCFSPTGRNRTCGEQLGRGRKRDEILEEIPGVVEGVPTTRAVVTLAEQYHVDMPITQGIYRVLFEGLDPLEGITQLMSREPKAERVG
jgi:glycerol-3-phosphate dehydrogenase (NAD(P)+)